MGPNFTAHSRALDTPSHRCSTLTGTVAIRVPSNFQSATHFAAARSEAYEKLSNTRREHCAGVHTLYLAEASPWQPITWRGRVKSRKKLDGCEPPITLPGIIFWRRLGKFWLLIRESGRTRMTSGVCTVLIDFRFATNARNLGKRPATSREYEALRAPRRGIAFRWGTELGSGEVKHFFGKEETLFNMT